MVKYRKLSSETLPNGIVKTLSILFNDGACQCFKDCDCYKDKGQVGEPFYLYNGETTEEKALSILRAKIKHEETIALYKEQAMAWRDSISIKSFNIVVNSFKRYHKQSPMKILNHSELYNDVTSVYLIHRYYLKHIHI